MTQRASAVRRSWLGDRLRRLLFGALAGGVVGGVSLLAANASAGADRAAGLAHTVGLSNSVLLAVIIGAAVSVWLIAVGRNSILALAGLLTGIGAVWLVYAFGRPHAWVLTAIMTGTLGPDAAPYSSLLGFLLLALAFRLAASLGRAAAEAALNQGRRAGLPPIPPEQH